jgi:RNA polymerase sigma factor for flagellar operon FliA
MPAAQSRRIVNGLPFVEALARRMASTMPHSIDVGDLVQDGVIGLIDAAHRFDEARGIKFETFAERRIRGAMIDALRRDAWPRGVRRVRRELEAARETLRRDWGHEPSLSDLGAKVGTDEKRLGRTIVRIHTIESTSPLATSETVDEACLPTALVPSEPEAPDAAYERCEMQDKVRAAIGSLPPREQKVITLYYYGDVTMKQIGAEIGVNESRVSQLHARAIKRLRVVLADMAPAEAMSALKSAVLAFHQKPVMAKARAASGRSVSQARGGCGEGPCVVSTSRPYEPRNTLPRRFTPSTPMCCGGGAISRRPLTGTGRSIVDGLSLFSVRMSRAFGADIAESDGLRARGSRCPWRNRRVFRLRSVHIFRSEHDAARRVGVQRGQFAKNWDAAIFGIFKSTHNQIVRLGGDAAERLFSPARSTTNPASIRASVTAAASAGSSSTTRTVDPASESKSNFCAASEGRCSGVPLTGSST